jgi:hypothetical protein
MLPPVDIKEKNFGEDDYQLLLNESGPNFQILRVSDIPVTVNSVQL